MENNKSEKLIVKPKISKKKNQENIFLKKKLEYFPQHEL